MTPSVLGDTTRSKKHKGLVFNFKRKGNIMKRVKNVFKELIKAIEINAALMYGYKVK